MYREASQAGLDPRFTRAVAAYEKAVDRALALEGPEQRAAVSVALDRLADALETVPLVPPRPLHASAAAMRRDRPGPALGFVAGTARLDAERRALWNAAEGFDTAAQTTYRSSPAVRAATRSFRSAVDRATDETGLRPDGEAELEALDEARFTFRALLTAASRKEVLLRKRDELEPDPRDLP